MATEEYQTGYEAGYQDGWNAAQQPQAECDAIAELNHAQWLALENVRTLANRNRKEEWAQHLLRFVEEAGTNKAQIMRRQVEQAQAEAVPSDVVRDAERLDWLIDGAGRRIAIDSFGGQYRIVDPTASLVVTDWYATKREAIDAAMAQGEKP